MSPEQDAVAEGRKPRRRILAMAVGACLVVAVGCAIWWVTRLDRNTPHGALIGHWRKARSKIIPDSGDYRGDVDTGNFSDLYVSHWSAWRVDTGSRPVRVSYKVLEQDQENFALTMCVTTTDGEKIYSLVTFSPDRKEMYTEMRHDVAKGMPSDIASMVRQQIGGVTSKDTYKRIDNKTSP